MYIHIVFNFATNCTDDLIQETFLSNVLSSTCSFDLRPRAFWAQVQKIRIRDPQGCLEYLLRIIVELTPHSLQALSKSVSQSVCLSVSHAAVSQSVSQSASQLVSQSAVSQSVSSQSVSQSVSQSAVSQSVCQSVCQSCSSQSVSQLSVSQPASQPVSQSVSQSAVSQSVICSDKGLALVTSPLKSF